MKKQLLVLAAVASFMVSTSAFGVTTNQTLLGDVNGDGRIDAFDVRLTTRFVLEANKQAYINSLKIPLSLSQFVANADIDKDGKVTRLDSYNILRKALGKGLLTNSKGTTAVIGDVDQNGTIDLLDVLMILKYQAKLIVPTDIQVFEVLADTDSDGMITKIDAQNIMRKIARLQPLLDRTGAAAKLGDVDGNGSVDLLDYFLLIKLIALPDNEARDVALENSKSFHAAQEAMVLADIDNNNVVNALDAFNILRKVAGLDLLKNKKGGNAVMGDLNLDGVINQSDASMVLAYLVCGDKAKYLKDNKLQNGLIFALGDMNGDGQIGLLDGVAIAKLAAVKK